MIRVLIFSFDHSSNKIKRSYIIKMKFNSLLYMFETISEFNCPENFEIYKLSDSCDIEIDINSKGVEIWTSRVYILIV